MLRLASARLRSVQSFSRMYSSADLSQQFKDAQAKLQSLSEDPGNATKLKIYALFKQATEGKCTKPKPGMMDFVGKAKWEAWTSLGEMTKDSAMQSYVQLVQELAGSSSSSEAAAATAAAGSSDYRESLYQVSDKGVCTFTLNRPAKKNALTTNLYEEWMRAMGTAAADDHVKVLAVTGAGDYFSSGNDLSNFTQLPPGVSMQQMAADANQLLHRFVSAFIDFPKPLVACVNGPAVGVSVSTLALYDLVLAADHATFHMPFSALGQTPEGCSSFTFPRMMGLSAAASMLMFNRRVTAAEAVSLKLVTEVLPKDTFDREAAIRLNQLAALPIQTLKLSKQLIRQPLKQQLHAVNRQECDQLQERWLSDDCINAITAFFTKKSKL